MRGLKRASGEMVGTKEGGVREAARRARSSGSWESEVVGRRWS